MLFVLVCFAEAICVWLVPQEELHSLFDEFPEKEVEMKQAARERLRKQYYARCSMFLAIRRAKGYLHSSSPSSAQRDREPPFRLVASPEAKPTPPSAVGTPVSAAPSAAPLSVVTSEAPKRRSQVQPLPPTAEVELAGSTSPQGSVDTPTHKKSSKVVPLMDTPPEAQGASTPTSGQPRTPTSGAERIRAASRRLVGPLATLNTALGVVEGPDVPKGAKGLLSGLRTSTRKVQGAGGLDLESLMTGYISRSSLRFNAGFDADDFPSSASRSPAAGDDNLDVDSIREYLTEPYIVVDGALVALRAMSVSTLSTLASPSILLHAGFRVDGPDGADVTGGAAPTRPAPVSRDRTSRSPAVSEVSPLHPPAMLPAPVSYAVA